MIIIENSQVYSDYENLFVFQKQFGNDYIESIKKYCLLSNVKNDIFPNSMNWKMYIIKYCNNTCGIIGFYKFSDNEYWIGWFGILEEFRNKGIGSFVLNKLIDIIKEENYEANKLLLYTECDNLLAHKFYKKNGMDYLSTVDEYCLDNNLKKEKYFSLMTIGDIIIYKNI